MTTISNERVVLELGKPYHGGTGEARRETRLRPIKGGARELDERPQVWRNFVLCSFVIILGPSFFLRASVVDFLKLYRYQRVATKQQLAKEQL